MSAEPTFLRKLRVREHLVGWATPCPDIHASAGFSVLIRPDEAVGRYRFECVEAAEGDPCATERQLVKLLGLEEADLSLSVGGVEPFAGLSHAEVLDLRFDERPSDLVEDLIDRGVLFVVAGLPETYKGWVCAQAAAIVAAGEGELFGHAARAQGPVGYLWQDDSTRNEAERIQLFARVRGTPRDLPIRWFLNEGAILPDDLDRLRATVERYEFVMVVLDSVYNFTPGLDLKDRDVGALFARIKSEVCDATDCTVVVVDHMPWATEQNRKRLRTYGDVFKGAAARAGIYIDADGSKLYVEARGNNITGFRRTPAYWDADALELRLVEAAAVGAEALDEELLAYIGEHPGEATTNIAKGVGHRRETAAKSLDRLLTAGRLTLKTSRDLGRPGTGHYWFPLNHPGFEASLFAGAPRDTPAPGPDQDGEASQASLPRRGDASLSGRLTERVVFGHEMYPVLLADAVRDGHLTNAEAESLYRVHRFVERVAAAPDAGHHQ